MILSFSITISLILLTKCIINILNNKYDNDIIFYVFSIIILLSSTCLFLLYYNNLTFSLITSLLLMILTFIFVLDIKNKYKQSIIYTIPFFIITIYLFAKTINCFLLLAHQ